MSRRPSHLVVVDEHYAERRREDAAWRPILERNAEARTREFLTSYLELRVDEHRLLNQPLTLPQEAIEKIHGARGKKRNRKVIDAWISEVVSIVASRCRATSIYTKPSEQNGAALQAALQELRRFLWHKRRENPAGSPRKIGSRLRFEVLKRDGFRCQYCGSEPERKMLHVDHIHPVAQGGSDDLENLTTACADCNMGKGARRLDEPRREVTENARKRRESP